MMTLAQELGALCLVAAGVLLGSWLARHGPRDPLRDDDVDDLLRHESRHEAAKRLYGRQDDEHRYLAWLYRRRPR